VLPQPKICNLKDRYQELKGSLSQNEEVWMIADGAEGWGA